MRRALVSLVLAASLSACSPVSTTTPAAAPPKPERPLTDREKLAGKRPEQSAWNGSYPEVRDYLRQRMHDPASLEWAGCTEVRWEAEARAYLVGCAYRGRNSLGAKVRNEGWFLIRNGAVVKAMDGNAYRWK